MCQSLCSHVPVLSCFCLVLGVPFFGGGVVSGFCHFRSSVIHGFVTEPDTPIMSGVFM